jgi:hypothetical protein
MTDFFNKFSEFLSYAEPGYVFTAFLTVAVAAFLASLHFSARRLKGYIKALRKASDYLSDASAGTLGKNNVGYFFKHYASDFPVAMQNRVAAYFNSLETKPSRFITEADCLKLSSFEAKQKTFLTLYEAVVLVAFLVASALSLAYGGAETFGVTAVLPLSVAALLRYILKFRNDSLEADLSDEFYIFVYAMDAAVVLKNDPEINDKESVLKKAGELIKELVEEEKEAQRYHFINAVDGLSRELRGDRLKEIAENVSAVCREKTSLATLKQIFNMLSESKDFYNSKEETEIFNACLVKLKNAMSLIEKDIIDL